MQTLLNGSTSKTTWILLKMTHVIFYFRIGCEGKVYYLKKYGKKNLKNLKKNNEKL